MIRTITVAVALAAVGAVAVPVATFAATSGNDALTITPAFTGALGISPPSAETLAVTMNTDGSATTQAFPADTVSVVDSTGSGAGWHVQAQIKTAFNFGSSGNGWVSVQSAPTTACGTGSTCVPAGSGAAITYPVSLAATPASVLSSGVNKGMGALTFPMSTFQLTVPGGTKTQTGYTGALTISIVSGP